MKLPRVYPLTIPSSHKMIRMIAMVSSMGFLLRTAPRGSLLAPFSNRYASPSAERRPRALIVVLLTFAMVPATSRPVRAQHAATAPSTANGHRAASVGKFLAGGALALAAHESGHLLFDGIFDANPGLKKVS